MSQEAVKAFVDKVNEDEELQSTIATFTGIPEETYRKLIKLAKENDFEFTDDDWKNYPVCEEPGKSKHGYTEWSDQLIVPWMK